MRKFNIFDMVLFTMLGVLMYVSDIALEFLPNVHGVSLIICVVTLVYRHKAIISVFVYIMLNAFFAMASGFTYWWIPYLYIFPLLWALLLLIPKGASIKLKVILSAIIIALHGLAFGTLYAPFQAIMFGLNFQSTLSWIAVGLPWDVVHMCGNIAMSTLIYPLYRVLIRLEETRKKGIGQK